MTLSKHSPLFKFTLLSISLFLGSASAMSGAIPVIHEDLHAVPLSWVENLMTIPSLSVLVMLLISPLIANKLGAKSTILLGLSISGIAGIIPVFTSNFYLIFLSRIALGLGLGIYNSLAYSIISFYYSGGERATMMGLQSAMTGIGNLILRILAGILISFSWHAVFIIYGLILLVIPLFLFLIPKNDSQSVDQTDNSDDSKHRESINVKVLVLAVAVMFLMLLPNLISIKLPSMVTYENIGTASTATMSLAVMGFAQMFGSALYGKIEQILQRWILPLAFFGGSFGIFIMVKAHTLGLIIVGGFVFGFFMSMAAPYLLTLAADVAPEGSANLASAVVLVGINITTFMAPTFWNATGKLLHDNAPRGIIANGCLLMTIMALLSVIYALKGSHKRVNKN